MHAHIGTLSIFQADYEVGGYNSEEEAKEAALNFLSKEISAKINYISITEELMSKLIVERNKLLMSMLDK
jgi:hypothetical protein